MIYTQPTTNELVNDLMNDDYANWSYEGASALIDYIEMLSDDIGEHIEFDRVALRCEYIEYASLEEVKGDYFSTPIHEIMQYVVARGKDFVIIRQF